MKKLGFTYYLEGEHTKLVYLITLLYFSFFSSFGFNKGYSYPFRMLSTALPHQGKTLNLASKKMLSWWLLVSISSCLPNINIMKKEVSLKKLNLYSVDSCNFDTALKFCCHPFHNPGSLHLPSGWIALTSISQMWTSILPEGAVVLHP
jgi:hypothetical protein